MRAGVRRSIASAGLGLAGATAGLWLGRAVGRDRAPVTRTSVGDRANAVVEPAAPPVGETSSSGSEHLDTLARLTKLAAPAGFIAALAYYFGWVRTRSLYRELGVDHAVLGLSPEDYALRSMSVLVTPLPVVGLAIAVAAIVYWILRWVAVIAIDHDRRVLAAAPAAIVGVVAIVVYARGPLAGTTRSTEHAARVFLIELAAVVTITACAAAHRCRRRGPRSHAQLGRRSQAAAFVLATGGLILVGSAAFDFVRLRAGDVGFSEAMDAEQHPGRYACVALTIDGSDRDQAETIFADAQVSTTSTGDEILVEGLRIFTRAAGRLIVWPSVRSPRQGVIILREDLITSARLVPQRGSASCH